MRDEAVEQFRLLVTVKAYPAISTKYGESVCVAGVTEPGPDQRWVRLFPVQFRELPTVQQFAKYQFIDLEVHPHSGDQRPETRKPNLDSLVLGQTLETGDGWSKRRPYIEPLMRSSMCEILRLQEADRLSLGVFRPREVEALEYEPVDGSWSSDQEAVANQPSLLFPSGGVLEQIPFKFWYRYRCEDSGCRGHRQSIIDWELGAAFRKWRERYRDDGEVMRALRDMWMGKLWAPDRDSALFVGSMHQHPSSFLVLGVYWPRREPLRLLS